MTLWPFAASVLPLSQMSRPGSQASTSEDFVRSLTALQLARIPVTQGAFEKVSLQKHLQE